MSTVIRVNPNVVTTQVIRLKQTGPQGAPGGGIDWDNAGWVLGTGYLLNAGLENGGSTYRCILNHTATADDEPGVGVNWETYWAILAEGASIDHAPYVTFDTAPVGVPVHAGTVSWDTLDHTLELQMDLGGVRMQLGQEEIFVGYNATGVEIPDGTPVSLDGVAGERSKIYVTDFNNATSVRCYLGVTTMAIPHLSEGLVTRSGLVRGLDTNAFNNEDRLWGSGVGGFTATEPTAGYKVLIGMVVKKAGLGSGMIYVNPRSAVLDGSIKTYHGIQTAGVPTFDDSTHVLTLPTSGGIIRYWHEGKMYYGTSNLTVDFDDQVTLTANTQYYVTLNDNTGAMTVSATPWLVAPNVLVATVYWNGTAGAVVDERHGYSRDRRWHATQHATIGALINPADFAITAPSVASPSTINIAGGTIYDEDLHTILSTLTNCRVWYQVAASQYTWANYNSVYPGTVQRIDASTYAPTDIATNQYINMWLYVAPDTQRGLYAFVETKATSGYNTAALARAVTPPLLTGFGLTNEMKLIYRVILKGDETFIEYTDYRASASVPVGGVSGVTAAAVTYSPGGNIVATTVQTAIEELDTEKLAHTGGTLTNYKETLYQVTTSGNTAMDLANGNAQRWILGGNHEIEFPSDPGAFGQSFYLVLECATYTPTWKATPAHEWLTSDGAAPTLVTTANLVNVLTFIWDDVDSRWLGFLAGKETA